MDVNKSPEEIAADEEAKRLADEAAAGKGGNQDPVIDRVAVENFLSENEDVYLDLLEKRTGKKFNSLDDVSEPVPENFKGFMDFLSKPGRTVEDYVKANKDWSKEPRDKVVMEYIRQTEGLEGDLLKDLYELEFAPNEDDASEREVKLAKIKFEKTYNKAVSFLQEQSDKLKVTPLEPGSQRDAGAAEADREKFESGMKEAIKSVTEIVVDDFKFKVPDADQAVDRYKNLETIIGNYTDEKSGFDHTKLYETLYKGENFEKMAKAYADQAVSKALEAEARRLDEGGARRDHSARNTGHVEVNKSISDFRKHG